MSDLSVCVFTDSRLSLLSLCRQCVGYLISQSEPSYMISGPWWLSWVRCWGRSIAPSHKPRLWSWPGRYTPHITHLGLNKSIIPLNCNVLLGSDVILFLFFSWFTYLLERNTTYPTSEALLRCWLLPHWLYSSKVIKRSKNFLFIFRYIYLCCLILYLLYRSTGSSWYCRIIYAPSCSGGFNVLVHCYARLQHTENVDLSLFCSFRFLKGSLTCTCLTRWMLKRCFTAVSIITCLYCIQVILTHMTQYLM